MHIIYSFITFMIFAFLTNTDPLVAQAEQLSTFKERPVLFSALLKAGIFHKDRQLIHFSHVCDLHIRAQSFPVIDIMELVKGAMTPRGINRIVVLNTTFVVMQTIEYTTERPLFCKNNQLFVFGDLMMGGVLPEGNVLTFTDDAQHVEISQVEVNKLPIPITGTKPQIFQ